MRVGRRGIVVFGAVLALGDGAAPAVDATGFEVFAADLSTNSVTGEKPQSKLWYNDGSWWAMLRGPEGVSFYEKVGSAWYRGAFVDAVLGSNGNADVKWDGALLHVLVYSSSPRYYEYTYDMALRVWNLAAGFPVSVPRPSGAETMVLETDSSGLAWAVAEGGNDVKAYWTTTADRRTWSKTPLVLRSGVASDDICSIVAFNGDRVGVFWSDQNRDEFGFRVHRDGDAPTDWQPLEVASSGPGHADDHLNLACDSGGRVYAVTKDDFDRHAVHRRDTDGTWSLVPDVTAGPGTRAILMLSEADERAYVLWTRWDASPDRIEYRTARLSDLSFTGSTALMSASSSLNNVTGTKQILPAGTLVAVAEGAGRVWWNGWGAPVPSTLPPPGAPGALAAVLRDSSARVELSWAPPVGATPDGYFVDRQRDGGGFTRLGTSLVTTTGCIDSTLVPGTLCYRVTAFANHQEGPPSAIACISYVPPPPGAPLAPTAAAELTLLVAGVAAYALDEGAGQTSADATGLQHQAQLGATGGAETSDPTWTVGPSGGALLFDGSNDRLRVEDAPDLHLAGSFTVEAWFQRAKLGTEHCIASKGDTGRRNFWVVLDAQNRIDFRWQTTGGTYHGTTSAATVADMAWHHVACAYDQVMGENRIYLDGALVERAADSGTPTTSTDPLLVGAKTTSGSIKSVFKGALDLVRVAPAALYAADFTPPTVFAAGAEQPIVRLVWQEPAVGVAAGYHVERRVEDGSFDRLTGALVAATTWVDLAPPAGPACYRLVAVDGLGREGPPSETACTAPAAAKGTPAGDMDVALGAPLLAAGPNPFNPATIIRFRLASASPVHLALYDVRGARVATLVDGPRQAGDHVVRWEADRQTASGSYFLVLRAGAARATRHLVLVK